MKILVVSSYLPYPLFDGGSIRLFNLLKQLQTKHEITLICELRPHQTKQDVAALEKICKKSNYSFTAKNNGVSVTFSRQDFLPRHS